MTPKQLIESLMSNGTATSYIQWQKPCRLQWAPDFSHCVLLKSDQSSPSRHRNNTDSDL